MKYIVSGRWHRSGKFKIETIEATSIEVAKTIFLLNTGCIAESATEIIESPTTKTVEQ